MPMSKQGAAAARGSLPTSHGTRDPRSVSESPVGLVTGVCRGPIGLQTAMARGRAPLVLALLAVLLYSSRVNGERGEGWLLRISTAGCSKFKL